MPTATMRFETTIYAPQTAVFATIADLTQHPKWAANELTITPVAKAETISAGQQYQSHAEVGNLEFDALLTITVYEPLARFGFKGEDSTGQFEQLFSITAVSQATKGERHFQFTLSFTQWVMFYLLYFPVRRPAASKALAQLKAQLEG